MLHAAQVRQHLGSEVLIYTTDPADVLDIGTLPGDEVYRYSPSLAGNAGRLLGTQALLLLWKSLLQLDAEQRQGVTSLISAAFLPENAVWPDSAFQSWHAHSRLD